MDLAVRSGNAESMPSEEVLNLLYETLDLMSQNMVKELEKKNKELTKVNVILINSVKEIEYKRKKQVGEMEATIRRLEAEIESYKERPQKIKQKKVKDPPSAPGEVNADFDLFRND